MEDEQHDWQWQDDDGVTYCARCGILDDDPDADLPCDRLLEQ